MVATPQLQQHRTSSNPGYATCPDTLAGTYERLRRAEEELERLRREDVGQSTVPVTSTRTRERLRHTEEELERLRCEGAGKSTAPATSTRTRERLRRTEEELQRLCCEDTGQSTAPATSTRTRERLREAEAKLEQLRREAGSPTLITAETSRRISDLKREEREATAKTKQRSTAGLFRATCSADLLFLIDTTGSMSPYITAAKNQVRSLVDELKAALLYETKLRIAIVGYKDHCDSPNIQFLDFTPSVSTVHSFLNRLTATGGGDQAEDVLGGINQALKATWVHQTRCIIHIADVPPHGSTLHDLKGPADVYPNPGSEPHGLRHESLLSQLIELHVNYTLLRINSSTDRMAFIFQQAYNAAAADCTLLAVNKYSRQIVGSQQGGSAGGLLFREAELGATLTALQTLVAQIRRRSTAPKAGLGLAPIEEEDERAPDVRLETAIPQWNSLGWLNETLSLEGFGLADIVHGATTLDDMMADDDNILISPQKLTIHKRKLPFAQGALRVAFYTRTAASTNRYVVKSFKRDGSQLAVLAVDMRCQALCKSFALEFNSLVEDGHSVDFLVTACFKGQSTSCGGDACISLEPFLEGTYVKYNSNTGGVNQKIPNDPANQAAQAFSHFTFERSLGQFLVCDLQGVGGLLTDPVIHTANPSRFPLSRTNLGMEGFKFFFASHECNHVCRELGLRSRRSMLVSREYNFRESWPAMPDTVCCSNNLCRRILRRASANESSNFRGYHWCDSCLLQLEAFKATRICVEPGPAHYFEVSSFFYESQGRNMPHFCEEHRRECVPMASSRGNRAAERDALVALEPGRARASIMVTDRLWDSLKSSIEKENER
ncbi:Alpha-protein kinase vwkA [Madurella mycetomatis]|uniref:Alpha-protein kinase vwkA n=1 Tax=Madurella mycetomatis TaxID=100816 RepID=A0A175VQA4_9PEZI|nr:Alpha-protein kinase vwkA [Madurella mycetomatis]